MDKFKKILSIIARISISVFLLIFLFKQVDRQILLGVIKNANHKLLILTFIFSSASYVFCIYRWYMLLKAAKINLPRRRVFISSAGAIFFNMFLPSTIGGDVVRSIDLATHTKKPKEVVATVLLDRLSGYVGLVLVALMAYAFGGRLIQHKSVILSVSIITAVLIVVLLVLFNKYIYKRINNLLQSPSSGKIREYITDLHEEMHLFRQQKKVLFYSLFISLGVQMVAPVTYYLTAVSLGVKMSVSYFFIILPIIGAITMLPISIGGLGLRDATTIFFFTKIGLSKDLAFAMSLINSFFMLIYAGAGGLVYVLTIRHRRIQHNQSSHFLSANSQQNKR